MLPDPKYSSAQRFIIQALIQAQKTQTSVMPHEMVEKLETEGVRADIGSAALWGMIGGGDVTLSPDWRLATKDYNEEPATA